MTKNFEEFPVYQKSLDLVEKVFIFLKHKDFEKEFEFNNQIKRAVFSISNNIAEGSEYNNNKQFIKYLKIAKGSCAEVRSMVFVAKRLNFGNIEMLEELIFVSKEISSNISNFIKYLAENLEKKAN